MSLICSNYDDSFVSTRLCAARYYGKIQDHDEAYYKSFNMIITGLDSVEARRWINATLVGMVDEDDPESLKPLIDGGTEGAFWDPRGGSSMVGVADRFAAFMTDQGSRVKRGLSCQPCRRVMSVRSVCRSNHDVVGEGS